MLGSEEYSNVENSGQKIMTSETDDGDGMTAFSELTDRSKSSLGQAGGMFKTLELEAPANLDLAEQAASALAFDTDASQIIMDLPVMMKVVLGSAKMPLATVAKLGKGSVVKLDKKVGEPVDIFVNGRLIAQGEVIVLDQDGNRFGVVLTRVGAPSHNGKKPD